MNLCSCVIVSVRPSGWRLYEKQHRPWSRKGSASWKRSSPFRTDKKCVTSALVRLQGSEQPLHTLIHLVLCLSVCVCDCTVLSGVCLCMCSGLSVTLWSSEVIHGVAGFCHSRNLMGRRQRDSFLHSTQGNIKVCMSTMFMVFFLTPCSSSVHINRITCTSWNRMCRLTASQCPHFKLSISTLQYPNCTVLYIQGVGNVIQYSPV